MIERFDFNQWVLCLSWRAT